MCGIAAIYNYHAHAGSVDRHELCTIRDYMAARGPDGKGAWYTADGRLGLGHRRLAILDLSTRGAQPMTTADGRYTISFNGEIYNYRELRRSLQGLGYCFQSDSDTEVLLYLYAQHGTTMLTQLRGMFAFALWDSDLQTLVLARDPYGIKPLYYADDGRSLRAASQVKALLAGGHIDRTADPAGVAGFYLFGSVPEPHTCYRGIRALPAGSYVLVSREGSGNVSTYASIAGFLCAAEAKPQAAAVDDLQREVRAALVESVEQHLIADVPVGAFLSAGVDSGVLTGLMAERLNIGHSAPTPYPLQTITLRFTEFDRQASDEAPLAESVARHYGTQHSTRTVSAQEFEQDLPAILAAMDQPSIDGVNTWFVSKAAKEQGWKVAVSGLGGDELFGGYPSFRDIPRWVRWCSRAAKISGFGEFFRALVSTLPCEKAGLSPKAAGLFVYGGSYAGAYLLKRGLFMPWELPRLFDPDFARAGLEALRPLLHIETQGLMPCPRRAYARVAALEASLYMRNQLLRDADWASMAHSLEIRVPLVDSFLLQRLSPYLLARQALNGKQWMAQAPRKALLGTVVERKKTGFGVPLQYWQKQQDQRQNTAPWARRHALFIGQAFGLGNY